MSRLKLEIGTKPELFINNAKMCEGQISALATIQTWHNSCSILL